MSSNVSAMIRTGVTYVLLSSITVSVVVMFILGITMLERISQWNGANVVMMQQGTIKRVNGSVVSGAAAWRILDENLGVVDTTSSGALDLEIVVDGVTYYDYNLLLTNHDFLSRFYTVDADTRDGTIWSIRLEATD